MTKEEQEFLKRYEEQVFHSFYEVERYALLLELDREFRKQADR
ncbi:hypothetical protein AB1I63_07575 [Streptococcus pneumoniae]